MLAHTSEKTGGILEFAGSLKYRLKEPSSQARLLCSLVCVVDMLAIHPLLITSKREPSMGRNTYVLM